MNVIQWMAIAIVIDIAAITLVWWFQ